MATKKAVKKSTVKKSSPKKATSNKATVKKTTKKSTKKSARKYGPAASKQVETELHLMKAGKLKSSAGQKVTNPKQAIAIALSEARAKGAKAPKAPKKKS